MRQVATTMAVRGASGGVSPLVRRLAGLGVAVASAVVLGLAAWLTPSPAGLGTHEQLDMPACGWIVLMDLPCPTCGMTTAFAHAANGNLVASFLAQPLGCLLAIATAMALFVGLHTAVTGSGLAGRLRVLWGPRSGWILAGLAVAAWVFKIISYRGLL